MDPHPCGRAANARLKAQRLLERPEYELKWSWILCDVAELVRPRARRRLSRSGRRDSSDRFKKHRGGQVVARCLGLPLLPPRDHLELWLDRRGLGVHSKALKKRGATRVSDLALLSDEELDDMGFMLDQRTEIRVRLTTPVIKSYA